MSVTMPAVEVTLVGESAGGELRAAFGYVWMAAALLALCAAPLSLGANTFISGKRA
jgi:hypothetical protein